MKKLNFDSVVVEFSDEIATELIADIEVKIEPLITELCGELKDVFSDIGVDYCEEVDFEISSSDLEEVIREFLICDSNVIGYYNAMKILLENDTSLQHSISIAVDLGYSLESINSELLASLYCEDESMSNVGLIPFENITETLDMFYWEISKIATDEGLDFEMGDIDINNCSFKIHFY